MLDYQKTEFYYLVLGSLFRKELQHKSTVTFDGSNKAKIIVSAMTLQGPGRHHQPEKTTEIVRSALAGTNLPAVSQGVDALVSALAVTGNNPRQLRRFLSALNKASEAEQFSPTAKANLVSLEPLLGTEMSLDLRLGYLRVLQRLEEDFLTMEGARSQHPIVRMPEDRQAFFRGVIIVVRQLFERSSTALTPRLLAAYAYSLLSTVRLDAASQYGGRVHAPVNTLVAFQRKGQEILPRKELATYRTAMARMAFTFGVEFEAPFSTWMHARRSPLSAEDTSNLSDVARALRQHLTRGRIPGLLTHMANLDAEQQRQSGRDLGFDEILSQIERFLNVRFK